MSSKNNKNIDQLLKDLDKIFKEDYLGYKKNKNPYSKIISEIKSYRKVSNLSDLILAVDTKIESKASFFNLNFTIWGILFAILGLFITISKDFIIDNYNNLPAINSIMSIQNIVLYSILFICTIIITCLFSISFETRKKNKEQNFYKLVKEILKSKD